VVFAVTAKDEMRKKNWGISENVDLAVEVKEVKSKETDSNLNILNLDIFTLTSTKFLKWHQFPC